MNKEEYEVEEQELIDINVKELNHENYSLKKHHKGKGKGRRPFSPWWHFINRIERRYYNKDCKEDYDLTKYHPVKLNMKKKDNY